MARKKTKKKKKGKAAASKKAEERKILESWKDPAVPGSFSGLQNFYRGLQEKGLTRGKTKSEVKDILEKDLFFATSRGLRRNFPKRKDLVFGLNERYEADLGDLGGRFKDLEGRVKGRYYLILIELFSRKLFCRALRDKSGPNVLAALKSIVEEDLKPPYQFEGTTLETDAGKEFLNGPCRRILESERVQHSISTAVHKARSVERANRSFKRVLVRYIETHARSTWEQAVNAVTDSLNRRYHRSLGMAPDQVVDHQRQVHDRNRRLRPRMPFYQHLKEERRIEAGGAVKERGKTFKLGDSVVIPFPRSILDKESDRAFKYMVYTISHIGNEESPYLYTLEDGMGDRVKRLYYASELRKVSVPSYFPISGVKETQMRGRRKYYKVAWLDYPDKYDQWIPATDLDKSLR